MPFSARVCFWVIGSSREALCFLLLRAQAFHAIRRRLSTPVYAACGLSISVHAIEVLVLYEERSRSGSGNLSHSTKYSLSLPLHTKYLQVGNVPR